MDFGGKGGGPKSGTLQDSFRKLNSSVSFRKIFRKSNGTEFFSSRVGAVRDEFGVVFRFRK